MCGIFGIITKEKTKFTKYSLDSAIKELFKFSESRGKEASGMAALAKNAIFLKKQPISASQFIKSGQYKNFFNLSSGVKKK